MLRLLGIVVTVVFAIAAAVLTWPQAFRLERTFPIAQLVSFRGVLILVFAAVLVLMLLFAIARPLRPVAMAIAVVALVAGVAGVAIVVNRGTAEGRLPQATDSSVRVMTWNTAGSATTPALIAQTAVAMEADVVALPETTIETGEQVAIAMRELGHPMWAYHAAYEGWDANSTTLLISPDLGDYSVIESSLDGSSNTAVVPSAVAMPVDGTGPIIVAAHAVAPRQDDMDTWRTDLEWLADQCAAENVIMAGDFNATVDHMDRLGVDGATLGRCHDSASQSGSGAVGTWPTIWAPLAGAPIDHVLATSGWRATGSVVLSSLDHAGGDHRPLIVQLEPVDG